MALEEWLEQLFVVKVGRCMFWNCCESWLAEMLSSGAELQTLSQVSHPQVRIWFGSNILLKAVETNFILRAASEEKPSNRWEGNKNSKCSVCMYWMTLPATHIFGLNPSSFTSCLVFSLLPHSCDQTSDQWDWFRLVGFPNKPWMLERLPVLHTGGEGVHTRSYSTDGETSLNNWVRVEKHSLDNIQSICVSAQVQIFTCE